MMRMLSLLFVFVFFFIGCQSGGSINEIEEMIVDIIVVDLEFVIRYFFMFFSELKVYFDVVIEGVIYDVGKFNFIISGEMYEFGV